MQLVLLFTGTVYIKCDINFCCVSVTVFLQAFLIFLLGEGGYSHIVKVGCMYVRKVIDMLLQVGLHVRVGFLTSRLYFC